MNCDRCRELGEPCRACERAAEQRAEKSDEIETSDPWGRDADWNHVRGAA